MIHGTNSSTDEALKKYGNWPNLKDPVTWWNGPIKPDSILPTTLHNDLFNAVCNAEVLKQPAGNPGTARKKPRYRNLICAFDVETTRLDSSVNPVFGDWVYDKRKHEKILSGSGCNEQAVIYLWQFHILGVGTWLGRSSESMKQLFECLAAACGESSLVIWVHNLSHEFQYFRGIHHFQSDEVFALDSRKVLKCNMGKQLEFRCSYLHSNMSLDQYLKKMRVENKKLTMDYSIKRYPWTPLDRETLAYSINDVVGLCQALKKEMDLFHDNLYTIPATSTGYVRRVIKHEMQKPWLKKRVAANFPSPKVYNLLRSAFAGGNTHANRHYSGLILKNVHSMDLKSSYPFALCSFQYPDGNWIEFNKISIEELHYLIYKWNRAVVIRFRVMDVKLRNPLEPVPMLSFSHCQGVQNISLDNGRILTADTLESTMTDVDFLEFCKQYTFSELYILEGAYCSYRRLPKEFISVICDFFKKKCELDGIPGQEIMYSKMKAMLNALYGMCATDAAKVLYKFIDDVFQPEEKTVEERLKDAKKHTFLNYSWGVWCTAWARHQLQKGIDAAGYRMVYCDTDSVKYVGEVLPMEEFNNKAIESSKESGLFGTNSEGETFYGGVFEKEEDCEEFATLGAKKYAYIKKGKLGVTISGVVKSLGGSELADGGGLKRFIKTGHYLPSGNWKDEGFTFHSAGGLELVYQDEPKISEIEIDGHMLQIGPNVVLRPSTYTLGITAEYRSLIQHGRLQYQDRS